MCAACDKARLGSFEGLTELAANPLKSTYLCSCAKCGALWAGHAFEPQIMWEFNENDARENFPDWQPTSVIKVSRT